MGIDQALSILAQIGTASLAVGGLYLLERLVQDYDRSEWDEMGRLRDELRESAREFAMNMKALNLEQGNHSMMKSLQPYPSILSAREGHDGEMDWTEFLGGASQIEAGARW